MWLVYFSAYVLGYLVNLVTNWLPCHMVVHVVLIITFGAWPVIFVQLLVVTLHTTLVMAQTLQRQLHKHSYCGNKYQNERCRFEQYSPSSSSYIVSLIAPWAFSGCALGSFCHQACEFYPGQVLVHTVFTQGQQIHSTTALLLCWRCITTCV